MSNNLVVFGPAHSGKSTLVGYLRAADMPPEEFRAEQRKLEIRLGNRYDPTDKYALLVDTHRDEVAGHAAGSGSSHYMHPVRTSIDSSSVLVIDTPGNERYQRERLRGLYYGDFGLLVMEISRFDKQDHLFQDFSPLSAWFGLGRSRRGLIVVISKLDERGFDEPVYRKAELIARQLVETVLGPQVTQMPLSIVPIAIDFGAEDDHNVLRRSTALPWYEGLTLAEAIDSFRIPRGESAAAEQEETFLLCIRRDVRVQHSKPAGLIVEGKVMSGSLRVNDAVKIGPIHYPGDLWSSVTGEVHEIRLLKATEPITEAQAGDMISFNLTRVASRRGHDRHRPNIPPTSIMVLERTECLAGNILQFEVLGRGMPRLVLLQTVMILWYGRLINVEIVEYLEEERMVTVELSSGGAAAALDRKSSVISHDFLMRVNRGGTHGGTEAALDEFIPVTLRRVSLPGTLRYKLPPSATRAALNLALGGHAVDLDAPSDFVLLDGGASYVVLMERLKNFEERLDTWSVSITDRVRLQPHDAERL